MTVTTEYATAFVSESGGWSSTSSCTGTENSVCTSLAGPGTDDHVIVDFGFTGIADSDTVSQVRVTYYGACGDDGASPYNGPDHDAEIQVAADGSTFCTGGHNMGIVATSCAGGGFGGWQACSHAQRPDTGAEVKSMRIKFNIAAEDGPDTCYIDALRVEVTHAPGGYSHNVSGVSAANIDKVDGVDTANIAAVDGVDT